jgi:hypothetical protein
MDAPKDQDWHDVLLAINARPAHTGPDRERGKDGLELVLNGWAFSHNGVLIR